MASGRSVWQLRTFVVSARAWLLYLRLGVSSVRPERTSLLLQPETRPRGAQTRRRLRPTTLCAFCRGRSRQSCTLISPLGEDSNRIHRQYGVWVQVRITKRDGEYFTLARRLDSAGGGTDAWTADGQTDEHNNLGRTAAVPPLLDPD